MHHYAVRKRQKHHGIELFFVTSVDKRRANSFGLAAIPQSSGPEGVKKWSLINVQLSFVIGGGASRNLFLNARRRRTQK
jgi:hypothetical protein